MPDFVPDLSVILTFALAAIVLAITPGPDMALFISRTVNYGRNHGLAASLGAITGLLVHIALAAFGITLLLVAAPTAFFALKIAGAIYLFWLAIQAVRAGNTLSISKQKLKKIRLRDSYLTGIGINLTNPKVVLFFVTFLPQFVSRTDPAASQKLLFLGAEFIVLSLPILVALIASAGWLATVLTSSIRAQRILNWSFAAVFATFALTILATETRR